MEIRPFTYTLTSDLALINTHCIDLDAVNCLAIMGAVGSGKSLLIKLLADSKLREVGAYSDYPFCAYLSQDLTRLFTGNTIDSILAIYRDKRYLVGQHFDRELFDDYVRLLKIDDLVKENRRLMHYSEGERQRLGLCLACAVKAGVTILDEPTTALNVEHRLALYDMVNGMKERTKVMIISHRLLDCLSVADHVIRMEDMRLQEHFPMKQIIEKKHILNYYLG